METIKKHVKEKKFDKLYFFHGEESFLSDYYVKLVKKYTVGDDEFNFISFVIKYPAETPLTLTFAVFFPISIWLCPAVYCKLIAYISSLNLLHISFIISSVK